MENNEALAAIEERLKSIKDRRMYERLQTIRLRLMGMPVCEIASIISRSEKTVRSYTHAYEKDGISGLTVLFF